MGNVALIVLDTLRKDAFDRHFDWVDGTRFERAYATANWTVPSHASLFTGKYASSVGVDSKHQTLDCDRPTLAERLQDRGYRTRAISANHNVSPIGNWDRGFEEFYTPSDLYFHNEDVLNWEEFLSTTDATGPELYAKAVKECFSSDSSTLKSLKAGYTYYQSGQRAASDIDDDGASVALDLLREWEFGDDEFLYLNLMEAHTPYDPPEGYPGAGADVTVDISHSLGLEAPVDGVERAYDGSVQYLSDVTESIYRELEPDFDCLVFLSDHGEMLGEHGIYNHTYGLYPSVINVPLVVCGPDVDRRPDAVTSLLDVYPTVLDAAGLDAPEDCDGQSLLTAGETDRYFAEYTGLLNKAVDQLQEGGLEQSRIDQFEAPLVSAALTDGYVYETQDGIEMSGDTQVDQSAVITEAKRTLSVNETLEGGAAEQEIPERQLKNLGYM